jgi:3-oxoacyl-[acyl-carrier protein] reductase
MQQQLNGKVAIVTGASKGIGAAIAKAFGAAGASVVVNYASSREGADRVVEEIVRRDGKAIAVQGDVSKLPDIQRLLEATKTAFGPVDVLVNNAGVYQFAPLEAVTEEEFQREFGINVLGPLLLTREALKYFRPGGGSVINVSSVVSQKAFPSTVVYSATKGALDAVTRVLAVELGARNIRVNTLAPGAIDTEGARTLGIAGGDMEKAIVAQTPLGRFGQPSDIARIAVFLASSDESGWLTGERIVASGGYA